MLCPNCKTELVELNGRYICSECGKEIPQNEVSVGSWGESDDKLEIKPTPGSTNVSSEKKSSLDEPEDYIVNQGTNSATADKATSENVTMSPADTLRANSVSNNPSTTSTEANDSFEALDKKIFGTQTQDPKPVESIEMPQAYQRGALESENAGNIDLNNKGIDVTLDSDIYTDPIFETPLSEDSPNQGKNSSIPKEQRLPVSEPEKESRINLIIIIIGSVLALIFLIVGIISVTSLSKKANVPLLDNTSLNDKLPNCDKAGSDEDKAQCISESFTICKPALWSGEYVSLPGVEANYQIMGPVDSSCQVNITIKKYVDVPEAENKTMSCQLDFSQEFTGATSALSATICSGDLSKILFKETTEENGETPSSAAPTTSTTPTLTPDVTAENTEG